MKISRKDTILTVACSVQNIVTASTTGRQRWVDCLLSSDRHLSRQYQLVLAFKKLVDEQFFALRTVQQYADKLTISAKYLAKVVRQQTSRSALQIIHARMEPQAKYLLSSTTLNVKHIACQPGFDTTSQFSRFFKKYTAVNPTQWKY